MYEFGLTGGIGSGKSTVGAGLVERGATLIDADAIVRELQEPGAAVFVAMVEHFGSQIVDVDGNLDRQAVAEIVFNDPDELEALNKLVHPGVLEEIKRIREGLAESETMVVTDVPLLVRADGTPSRRDEYNHFLGIIVVDCDQETALDRLIEHRRFSEADARARISNQASRADRLAVADHVVDNDGNLADLELQLDACWSWMQSLADGPSPLPDVSGT